MANPGTECKEIPQQARLSPGLSLVSREESRATTLRVMDGNVTRSVTSPYFIFPFGVVSHMQPQHTGVPFM
jgi:hypothetical protein